MAKKTRIEILADWLEKQAADISLTDGRIMERMGVGNGTFYRYKPQAVSLVQKRAEIRMKERERMEVQAAHEAAVMGIKTRSQRIVEIQQEIDVMERQLRGDLPFTWNNYGKVMKSHAGDVFNAPIQVLNDLRKLIKDYRAEISKIEGDYAPEKRQVEDVTQKKEVVLKIVRRKKA